MSKQRKQLSSGLQNRLQNTSIQDDNYGTGEAGSTPDDLKNLVSIPKLQEQIKYMSQNAVILADDGVDIQLPYKASPAGLELQSNMPLEDFKQIGHALFKMSDRISLFIGDWLVAIYEREEPPHGLQTEMAEAYNFEPATLHNWKSLCTSVDISLRSEVLAKYPNHTLRKSHYELVRTMKKPDQRKWLLKAAKNGMTVSQLRQEIKEARGTDTAPKIPTFYQLAREYLDSSYHSKLVKKAKEGDPKALGELQDQIKHVAEYLILLQNEIKQIEETE